MKTTHLLPDAARAFRWSHQPGFTLLVTLLMMVLLTILALGILSLSTVTLRTSQAQTAQGVARANARLALMMAIGELQKQTGPDQRITFAADQLPGGADGSTTAATVTRNHWTGVCKSWLNTATTRPATPEFQSWLVSAPPQSAISLDFVKSPSSGSVVTLVDKGSLGTAPNGRVEVPLIDCTTAGAVSSRYGWWVGDQGVKAPVATPTPTTSQDLASIRQSLQSASRAAIEFATTSDSKVPFSALDKNSSQVRQLTDWQQAQFVASSTAGPKPLFHDLAGHSPGLLTNVRAGGFRKDLSMYLEQPLDDSMKTTALYSVSGTKGINWSELWVYYNLYNQARGGLQTGGSYAYTSGGVMDTSAPYLKLSPDMTGIGSDPATPYKQPSFISMKTILSLYGVPVTSGSPAVTKVRLYLVVDPVVTYWNPLDVPLVITPAFNSVKYWKPPYNLNVKRAGSTDTYNLATALAGGGTQYIAFRIGKTKPIVLRPGEVLMFSEAPGASSPTVFSAGRAVIDADLGFQFVSGMSFLLNTAKDTAKDLATTETFTYDFTPNTVDSGYFLTANETYFLNTLSGTQEGDYMALGTGATISPKVGSTVPIHASDSQYSDLFAKNLTVEHGRPLTASQINGQKQPVVIMAYSAKTEQDSDRPGKFLTRYNPKAGTSFRNLQPDEFETQPMEIQIDSLTSWKDPKLKLEVSTTGQAYFGGGMSAQYGSKIVTTHSVPREPMLSLASFQYAMANGFNWSSVPSPGSGTVLNGGSYMQPQISHAIGNSEACSVIPQSQTSATTTASSAQGGPAPLADHSYLANQALWDDWFLSGIANQTGAGFTTNKRSTSKVALDFFTNAKPCPNSRYLFSGTDTGESPSALVGRWFSADVPTANAKDEIASALTVDGMFNVNSTSVQAWKTLLTGLNKQLVAVRNNSGQEVTASTNGLLPVTALQTPDSTILKTGTSVGITDSTQWTGRRMLASDEIDTLAQAIVKEVRKRGPFLSLSDFINRRPGSDKNLARAGVVQSALDSPDVKINAAYNTGSRAATPTVSLNGNTRGYNFVEAENGPAAYGAPGVVKQADLLTPLAPYLSARSDTFVIRAYGETLDSSGKVISRAWCEAEVTRGAAYVDPTNKSIVATASLTQTNATFGRRYQMTSFRWLSPSEI